MTAATSKNFSVGTTLTDKHGKWTLTSKYDEGTWEARGERGSKVIFESDARFYTVNV